MNGPVAVDWTPALLVLAAGLVLGTVLVWRVLGRARAAPAPGSEGGSLLRRDLEGKRDALLLQLRELDDTGGKRSAEQAAYERYDLELRAARVVLALDGMTGAPSAGPAAPPASAPAPGAAPAATSASAPAPAAGNAGLRGFLWGTLSASTVGLLFFFLYTQARPRTEGGSVTGDVPAPPSRGAGAASGGMAGEGPETAPAPGPEEEKLRERIASHPDDLAARMELARAALARQDMMAVWNETKAILERSPGHAPALAYQALVRLAMGQGDKAEEMLRQALASDPNLVDAYVHLALVYARLGRMGEADKVIADAASRFPGQAAALQRLLADLKQNDAREDMAAVGSADPQADPHAGIDAPGAPGARGPDAGRPAGAAARAGEGPAPGGAGSPKRTVSGVVELDPALAGQVSASGILFVFVREAGFGAGPPVAARRFPVSSFPMGFEIGEEDAMMGQAFPDTLLVEARLDADGDPTTRPPTDPKARIDDVKAGSRTVRLLLKRP